jgi:hypothetical protein
LRAPIAGSRAPRNGWGGAGLWGGWPGDLSRRVAALEERSFGSLYNPLYTSRGGSQTVAEDRFNIPLTIEDMRFHRDLLAAMYDAAFEAESDSVGLLGGWLLFWQDAITLFQGEGES